ncbi:aspartate/glutamate racemase family protein [Deltaproteobacteria bacterium OttesenSCG-928-M10]|nr:aspartate/glutamate racemase family protein [Deltaproteobacteria bacterium OttesenSCG-928-M10]
MPKYYSRPQAASYGHAIGILLIDCVTPFIPGDVGNASTYNFPVIYRTIPDVTITRLVDQGDKTLTDNVVKTARELEEYGVRAIASDCGYMIHFQREVAEAVKVPVILSSLIQLPTIERSLGSKEKIGILCAKAATLTPDMLKLAGLADPGRAVVYGMQDSEAFAGPMTFEKPLLDSDIIEKDIVAKAEKMISENPEVAAIVLECSNMPPYAHAIQAATGRPVFDFITLINYYQAASFRREYAGFY